MESEAAEKDKHCVRQDKGHRAPCAGALRDSVFLHGALCGRTVRAQCAAPCGLKWYENTIQALSEGSVRVTNESSRASFRRADRAA